MPSASAQADVCRADPCRRALARAQDERVRAASVEGDPRRTRPRSCRAETARCEPRPHRIPNPFIQQEPDLTPARHMLRPPFEVESYINQNIQAADWIATIVGRLGAYEILPTEYADHAAL